MVATQKAISANEEIQDKIRARAAVTTDSGEGTTELGQQIDKLMAALTKAGQGSNPASAPGSPRKRGCGRGCADRSTPSCPSSHNSQDSLGRPPQTTAHLLAVGQGLPYVEIKGRSVMGLKLGVKLQPGGISTLSSVLDARAGAIWHGNVPLQPQLYTSLGELRECGPTHH